MQRTTTLGLTLALLLGGVALAVDADPDDLPFEPTSIGEAIIGFHAGQLPDVKVGDHYAGMLVIQVVERGGFIVVRATDLGVVALRTDGMQEVAYVEDNGLLQSLHVPDDTRYDEQWGPAPMGFETAWDAGLGSTDVVVAVLDTGLRRTHSDFDPALLLQGHDYVNDDTNPNDDCGHGTHVAGTVGAKTDNARGVAGMSQSKILPMKVLAPLLFVTCSGSNADIADAIYDSTDQGADIISMSLGGSSGSTTLRNAVDDAWANGVLVVAAAGNNNGGSVSYPAAYDSVIAVSALASNLNIASYSSTGPQVEVSAPGSNVLSTYNSNDNAYSSLSGTSMAAPHVAGALALALSQAPGHTAAEVRSAMQATAQDLGPAGRDNQYGYGMVRVDSLVAALGGSPPPPPPPPGNEAPVAAFTFSTDGLTVSVDASGSSDPDGDALTFAWTFGDGASASGLTASHAYASGGTYTVTLTVDDGNGGTDTAAEQVTVTDPGDPDPSVPNLASGTQVSVQLSGSGDEEFYKIFVAVGQSNLEVRMTGPGCGLLNCPLDADLYTRLGAKPTDSQWDCRPYLSGNNEECDHASPGSGWWYVRVKSYSGSGTVQLTATIT